MKITKEVEITTRVEMSEHEFMNLIGTQAYLGQGETRVDDIRINGVLVNIEWLRPEGVTLTFLEQEEAEVL